MRTSVPVLAALLATALATVSHAGQARYETLHAARASEILPAPLVQSIHHRLREQVGFDGTHFVFDVESQFGVERVHSVPLLRLRLHEIHTMAQALTQFDADDEALARALRGRRGVGADSVVDILTDPVGTASQLASNLGDNLERTLSGAYLAPDAHEAGAQAQGPRADPGPYKRGVAAQLGLDVYSSNAAVQAFLDRVAAARASGRLGGSIATIAPAGRQGPIQRREVDDLRFDAQLRRHTPAELRDLQARALAQAGVDAAIAQRFLGNPVLSPRHRTYLTGYLQLLAGVGNRGALIAAAASAGSEAEALGYQALARMLVHEHRDGAGLVRLDGDAPLPAALTGDGALLLLAPVDHVIWNADTEAVITALLARTAALGARGATLAITGTFSARARAAMEARGVRWRAGESG